MALPTILFNNGTGSDSLASGAGPAAAKTGTAATFAASVVTLDGTPDLSGVAADGSAVLFMITTTGAMFFKITAVNDALDTVTVTPAPAGTATGRTWAIGGKRKTIGETNSRLLFSADALGGWIIQLEDDQPALTSAVVCSASGSQSTGNIKLRGDSATTRRLLTSATNNISPLNGGLVNWVVENLKFESTAATKTTSYGVNFDANGSAEFCTFKNCIFGHATNKLQRAINRDGVSQRSLNVIGCVIQNCLGSGMGNGGASTSSIYLLGCSIRSNSGAGLAVEFSGLADLNIEDCEIYANGGDGIFVVADGSNQHRVAVHNCTIHGNTGDGIEIQNVRNLLGAMVWNNQITGNGGWGLLYGGVAVDVAAFIDYNNFGTGATANTSGSMSGITAGSHDVALDPGYANAGSGDFTIGAATAAIGFPATLGQI